MCVRADTTGMHALLGLVDAKHALGDDKVPQVVGLVWRRVVVVVAAHAVVAEAVRVLQPQLQVLRPSWWC